MTLDQWIGLWVIVAAAVVNTAAACLVIGGLVVVHRMDGRRGGCRGDGCRRSAGADGTGSPVDGPAGERLHGSEWPLGVIEFDTYRKGKP